MSATKRRLCGIARVIHHGFLPPKESFPRSGHSARRLPAHPLTGRPRASNLFVRRFEDQLAGA
jgi:hypothetical protein